jgi:hypothetical protein
MKLINALATAAVLALASTSASATIINLDGPDSDGIVLNLAAGTYDLKVVGIAGGGLYDAWNAWSSVSGCDGEGANCATGFLVTYAVDLGAGGTFNQTNGFQVLPITRDIFDTASKALTSFNTQPIRQCAFAGGCVQLGGHSSSFTLAAAQAVNFLILDTPYFDNSGGVSLLLTERNINAIPEPSTWAMLLAGFGLAGTVRRRQRALAA